MSKEAESDNENRSDASPRVERAIRDVPREPFSGVEFERATSRRFPVLLGSPPPANTLGKIVHALAVEPGDRILEVGTGTGYTAALLAQLGLDVVTYERIPALAHTARKVLAELGADDVEVRQGDGLRDLDDETFDAILVSASGVTVPSRLLHNLKVGGRLVVPLGPTIGPNSSFGSRGPMTKNSTKSCSARSSSPGGWETS